MRALVLELAVVLVGAGCAPELGETPFACGADASCPDGYTCQSTVCVKDGAKLVASRPERIVWINAGEMTWFAASGGGATLVVNDGFTAGAHGIYAIDVDPEGKAGAPRLLLSYGDEFPMASSVVALDDGRFGIATLSFPNVGSDEETLEVLGVDRTAPEGTLPSRESLFVEKEPFLGGTEPAYVAAASDGASIDVAWTRPSQGGRVEVVHLEKQGSVWGSPSMPLSQPLPADVPPLSGDCLLWRTSEGLTVRTGFEKFAIAEVAGGTFSPFVEMGDDVPMFAFAGQALSLRYGDYDPANAAYGASYVLATNDGADVEVDDAGVIQETLEPFTSVAFQDGALVAPLSDDPGFATLGVGYRSPDQPLVRVAEVARPGSDALYSARAFGQGGRVWLAWTSFHEALMDLWVAVAPMGSTTKSAVSRSSDRSRASAPVRVVTFAIEGLPRRRGR